LAYDSAALRQQHGNDCQTATMDVGQPENKGNLVNTTPKTKCIVMATEMERKNEMPFNT
jgi:stress response protein SCP2